MSFHTSNFTFASAFTQDLNKNTNTSFQQIPFNLEQWMNIGNSDSDVTSTLQAENKTNDFPDTSLIMAIDGNNNILNIGNSDSDVTSTLQAENKTNDFPDTSLIMAIDGNNNILINNDNTYSTLLKLDFVGKIDLTESSQIIFECRIDSSIFEICSSPIIIDSLKVGEHLFEVRAIDQSGKVDDTPANFRWIILNESIPSIDNNNNNNTTIDLSSPLMNTTSTKDKQHTTIPNEAIPNIDNNNDNDDDDTTIDLSSPSMNTISAKDKHRTTILDLLH